MLKRLRKMVVGCVRPVEQRAHIGPVPERGDPLLWFRDLGQQPFGDFSIAVVQANTLLEDHSQIETGPGRTFVGVYDGHGGPEAAQYINRNLFPNLQKHAAEAGGVSGEVLRKAILSTEDGFETLVTKAWPIKPQIAAVGSCCLVGLIYERKLYLGNLGDSRAVMGKLTGTRGSIKAVQLTPEHNASIAAVRQELIALHPDDSRIVVQRQGVWRVKGIIQVTKSIGDVYLKKAEFNREPLIPRFRLTEPLERPVLNAEPSIEEYTLQPEDQFIIFASDGLWEHITNQKAVEIVHKHPRKGIAKRLVKAAILEAVRKLGTVTYSKVIDTERGARRLFHDDITVVVIYLDQQQLRSNGSEQRVAPLSIRVGVNISEELSNDSTSDPLAAANLNASGHSLIPRSDNRVSMHSF